MGPKVISVIGFIDMDLFMTTERMPDLGETLLAKKYSSSPGGKGANAAVAAFRSSHVKVKIGDDGYRFENPFEEIDIHVRMIGAVGNDPNGTQAKDNLADNGVDISGVRTIEGEETGVCFCIVEAFSGENRLLLTTGATARLMPEDFLTAEDLGSGVRPDLVISQLEVRRRTVEQILRTAKKAGIEVLLNAAPAKQILSDLYGCVTHLIVNETEAATLSGVDIEDVNQGTWAELAEQYLDSGVKNVVITLGKQGAYYANAHDRGHAPADEVKVEDVTGAGDTFVGVYATEYLRQKESNEWKSPGEWNIEKAIKLANRGSGHTIAKVGAQATIPWADEIQDFAVDSTVDGFSRLTTEEA